MTNKETFLERNIRRSTTRKNTLRVINQFEPEIKELGGKLSDLERRLNPEIKQTIITFSNGYGISFVKGGISYGLEAAIITYQDDSFKLCYDTDITDDVIGYMDEEDILPLLKKVAELPGK